MAGRAHVSAPELLDLIHAVNPTAQGLGPREQAERYAQKSRLQSLLIRKFGEALSVERDGADERVVSIRYRAFERNGCHALIASLDDDARSWVLRRIDERAAPALPSGHARPASSPPATQTPPAGGKGASEPPRGHDVEGLLQRGRDALDAYDYEVASQCFSEALDRSSGQAAAAQCLLMLMVDHLAADRDALALRARLSRDALQSPDVRGLLAVAAARVEEVADARALCSGASSDRVVEALCVLGERALRDNALDESERLIAEAAAVEAAHARVQGLREALDQARKQAREPLEQQLSVVLASGDLGRAETMAQDLLAQASDSAVARRALRAIADQRAQAEFQRLMACVDDAVARGALDAAVSTLRQASAIAPDVEARTSSAARLATLEAERAELALQARVEANVAKLEEPDPWPGVSEFAALSPEARKRVRRLANRPELHDVELMLGAGVSPDAAAAASRALQDALAIADTDPSAGLALLEAHGKALQSHPGAARARALANDRLGEARQRETEKLMQSARAILARGDARAALDALGRIDARAATRPQRETIDAMRASAERQLVREANVCEFERLLHSGDALRARELADHCLADAADPAPEQWQAARSAAVAAVRRAFRVWLAHTPDAPLPLADGALPPASGTGATIPIGRTGERPLTREELHAALDSGARSLTLCEPQDCWLFVRIVDLALRRVQTRLVLRLPERIDSVEVQYSPPSTLRLLGANGAVLELCPHTGDVRMWRSGSDVLPLDEIIERTSLAGDGRFLWLVSRKRLGSERVRVVDLARRRVARELPEGWWLQPVLGASVPTMACSFSLQVLSLFEPRGVPLTNAKTRLGGGLGNALVHPSGRGLLVLVIEEDERLDRDVALGWVQIDEAGNASEVQWLPETLAEAPHACATSLDQGLSFLLASVSGAGNELRAYAPEGERLVQVWAVPLATDDQLVQDIDSRSVALVRTHGSHIAYIPLGMQAPALPVADPGPSSVPSLDTFVNECASADDEDEQDLFGLIEALQPMSDDAALVEVRARMQAPAADLPSVFALCDAARRTGKSRACHAAVEWMNARHPHDPHTALASALGFADDGRWEDVRQVLGNMDLDTLQANRRQHAHHLLARALLEAGESQRAHHVLQRAAAGGVGRCKLQPLIDLAAPLPPDASGDSPVLALRRAVECADAALARSANAEALTAIDIDVVWRSHEQQSLARLAEAHLRNDPMDDATLFQKALALATFLEVQRTQFYRRDYPLPTARWSEPQLTDLGARAQAWLDALGER